MATLWQKTVVGAEGVMDFMLQKSIERLSLGGGNGVVYVLFD